MSYPLDPNSVPRDGNIISHKNTSNLTTMCQFQWNTYNDEERHFPFELIQLLVNPRQLLDSKPTSSPRLQAKPKRFENQVEPTYMHTFQIILALLSA